VNGRELHAIVAASVAMLAACSVSDEARRSATSPSFERDIAPVLEARCARARGCHGEEPTPQVDLDLRRDRAYGQLVGVRAETGRVRLLRVEPGHPAASLLVQKLTGRGGPGSGKRMPLDPESGEPITPTPIAAAWVDEVLVRWIEAGSPQN
jgi:hypothetical protein